MDMYNILQNLDSVINKSSDKAGSKTQISEGQDRSDIPAALRKERGDPELTMKDFKQSKGDMSDRRTLEKMPGGHEGRYRKELDEGDKDYIQVADSGAEIMINGKPAVVLGELPAPRGQATYYAVRFKDQPYPPGTYDQENLSKIYRELPSFKNKDRQSESQVNENQKEIDYSSLEIDGIDYRDAPEFSDAYFSYGEYEDGTPLSDTELDQLSMDGDLLNQMVTDKLYETDVGEDQEIAELNKSTLGSYVKKASKDAATKTALAVGADEEGDFEVGTALDKEADKRLAGVNRAADRLSKSSVGEADMEEGNEFSGALAKAKAAGAEKFSVDGKEYPVKESYSDFFDKKIAYQKIGADVEGSSEDYTVTFRDGTRKRYVEKDGRRRVTTLSPVDRKDDVDDEGNVVKRGRGRPAGTGRAMGAKGPTGRSKLMREQDIDPADRGEYNREGDMALNQLHQIGDAVGELHAILGAEENLPEWVQSKITKAVDYLDTARDYLKAKDAQYIMRGEEPVAEQQAADDRAVVAKLRENLEKLRKAGPHAQGSKEQKKISELEKRIDSANSTNEAKKRKPSLRNPEDNPCWKGYKPVGTKQKNGKTVPNCVPKESIEEGQIDEKAVSKSQQQAAGAALAAKRGDASKSDLTGASKEMMSMSTKELKKYAGTKHTGLPDKKDESIDEAKPDFLDLDKDGDKKESMKKAAADKKQGKAEDKDEVEETTTAGSVATGGEANTAAGSMYGKGVYENAFAESYDKKINQILSESISINASDSTEGGKSITITATEEDADKLGELLKMAGMFDGSSRQSVDVDDSPCSECGGAGGLHESECSHRMDEEYANEPDELYNDMDTILNKFAGGLNGPKKQVNPNNPGDNPLAMKRLGQKSSGQVDLGAVAEDIETSAQTRLMDLYKRYK